MRSNSAAIEGLFGVTYPYANKNHYLKSNAHSIHYPSPNFNARAARIRILKLYGTAGAVISRAPSTKSLYFQPLLNFANAPNGIARA